MIKFFGKTWCGDCVRAKQFLDDNKAAYKYIDIGKETQYVEYVLAINNGQESVPTIVFQDGSVLVEPTNRQLADKLSEQDLGDDRV